MRRQALRQHGFPSQWANPRSVSFALRVGKAESALGAVKHVLGRTNILNKVRHAGAKAQAAVFNRDKAGLKGLGYGGSLCLTTVVDKLDPSTYWQPGQQSDGDM